jgi:NNP family nitrate/nitrite transporter-like MFS transporter
MWTSITVQMLNLGFPFTQAQLFTLTAIAGIAGASEHLYRYFYCALTRLSPMVSRGYDGAAQAPA